MPFLYDEMKLIHYILGFLLLLTLQLNAQFTIQGEVWAMDSNLPLGQVSVTLDGQELQVFTTTDGVFSIRSGHDTGVLTIAKDGYKTLSQSYKGANDLGVIFLEKDIVTLDEVVLNAPAKEQLAEGIITYDLPQSKTGPLIFAQEPTHVFKTIPSVYQSTQGGGEGDSSIKYRGFDVSDTRFSINGIAVNDMESDWIYWSNWSSIMDVAQDIKMTSGTQGVTGSQPSQGGQVSVRTIHSESKNFTKFNLSAGSDVSLKTSVMYHHYSPKHDGQLTVFFSRKNGEGFVDATAYKNYTYYLDFTKEWEQHRLSGFVFGAPQWHQQRSDYADKMATLQNYLDYGTGYNYNYGLYRGKSMTWTENYFHKNINGLQWTWDYNPTGNLMALLYSSVGTGGGTYENGSSYSYIFANQSAWRHTTDGSVMWDTIEAYNTGATVTLSDGQTLQRFDHSVDNGWINSPYGTGISKVSFTNKHYWVGSNVQWKQQLNNRLTLHAGYQFRHAKADNFDRLIDLLGADGYSPYFDQNNQGQIYTATGEATLKTAWDLFQKPDDYQALNFHYRSLINNHTLSHTWEYAYDRWSFNTNLLWTARQNQRVDFFNYLTDDPDRTSDKIMTYGWQINQHIGWQTNHGQLFLNAGWLQKPSRFDRLFLNYKNDVNTHLTKERVTTFEAGHLYNKGSFNWTNVLYFIAFKDRYVAAPYQNPDTNQSGTMFFNNVNQQHLGWESSIHWTIDKRWSLDAYMGLAQWEYKGKARGTAYDFNQQNIGALSLDLDGKKVGDAAQISGKMVLGYKPVKNLSIALNYQYNDGLYAKLNASADSALNELKLPAYHLFDFEANYKIPLKSKDELLLSLAVNNVLNSTYISTAYTALGYNDAGVDTWNGVPVNNKVFFGLQRYGFFGVKYVLK